MEGSFPISQMSFCKTVITDAFIILQEARIFEQEEAVQNQKETEDRVAAAVLTTGYIADLLPSVMKGLKDAGYLYEEVKDGK